MPESAPYNECYTAPDQLEVLGGPGYQGTEPHLCLCVSRPNPRPSIDSVVGRRFIL